MTACPKCNHEFDWEESFTTERSGRGHNHEFGQTEYWAEGTVKCPSCGATWEHGDSSL
jgi:endogenous inhibitor of DNA gyrase (YacG/DUF329 family)